jgi:hypothetical protein
LASVLILVWKKAETYVRAASSQNQKDHQDQIRQVGHHGMRSRRDHPGMAIILLCGVEGGRGLG